MKVLLIHPVPPARWQIPRYPQGLGSIAAVLKKAGHEIEVLTLSELNRAALDETIGRFQPGLAGISLTSNFFALGRAIARCLSADYHVPVVLGGVHPTLCPEESLAAEGVFAICIGEGEYPMRELCDALDHDRDPTRIANLWVRHDGKVHRNELRPLIATLDELPFPDRASFRFGDMLEPFPEAEFLGSRGCPYLCTYCANHALQELYRGKGRYVRFRSVDHLLAEVDQVLRDYPRVEWLGFHDDTFTLNRAWLREFAEKYPLSQRPRFWCNATANSITDETVGLLQRAGCYEVRIGVESGDDRLRMEVLQKNVTRDQIVRAFRLLREAGIRRYAFNMIGLPFETPKTIEATVRLNQEIQPDTLFCSIFFPYPGTRSHALCRDQGWIAPRQMSSYFERDYALEQPTITRQQVLFYYDLFNDLVRWPRWAPLIKLLHRIPVTRTKTAWNAVRRVRARLKRRMTPTA